MGLSRKRRQFGVSDEDSLSLAKMNTNRCSQKTSRNQICFVDIRFACTSLRELCLIFEFLLLVDVIPPKVDERETRDEKKTLNYMELVTIHVVRRKRLEENE